MLAGIRGRFTLRNGLLGFINESLDLSKIESGKMDVELGPVQLGQLQDYCYGTFAPRAEGRAGLRPSTRTTDAGDRFTRTQAPAAGAENCCHNRAEIYGTRHGAVEDLTSLPPDGAPINPYSDASRASWPSRNRHGYGIPQEKQRIIFEAFNSRRTTSRQVRGTAGLHQP